MVQDQSESHQYNHIPDHVQYNEQNSYDIGLTLSSWEQVGSLTSEIASSVMARQASILCELSRPPSKRRRLNTTNNMQGTMTTQPSLIVTSDEDDGHLSTTSTSDEEDGSFPESNDTANNNNGNDDTESPLLSENVFRQIDRLGRMSKLMIEMEYCHRQMQAEIRAMADDNDL